MLRIEKVSHLNFRGQARRLGGNEMNKYLVFYECVQRYGVWVDAESIKEARCRAEDVVEEYESGEETKAVEDMLNGMQLGDLQYTDTHQIDPKVENNPVHRIGD
jgi:hypothetical protein